MDATQQLFLGTPVALNTQTFVMLINSNSNEDVQNILDWFHSFILTSDVGILKKLLKFCFGFSNVSSSDSDKIIALCFVQDKVLPRASPYVHFIYLILPLKCANEHDFIAMMKVALNCKCEGFPEL